MSGGLRVQRHRSGPRQDEERCWGKIATLGPADTRVLQLDLSFVACAEHDWIPPDYEMEVPLGGAQAVVCLCQSPLKSQFMRSKRPW